jgi:pantoate--beta-alanine ligase
MKVFKTIGSMRQWSAETQRDNKTIGLVPTMGYLHTGHLSLIRKAKQVADKVVVSIFVNPTQFAAGEDFDTYPSDPEADYSLCRKEAVDAVFNPDRQEIYAPNFQTYVENQQIGHLLCGISRPSHFRGVTTIVAKLFNIVDPDMAVFGQKDAQQAIIIKNMVRDLNFKTHILVEPIIREEDGLAMSSRNKYLTARQRESALILSQCLVYAREQTETASATIAELQNEIRARINNTAECRVDYVEFVNADTLQSPVKKGDKVLLALAVFVGSTRLIDNTILNW